AAITMPTTSNTNAPITQLHATFFAVSPGFESKFDGTSAGEISRPVPAARRLVSTRASVAVGGWPVKSTSRGSGFGKSPAGLPRVGWARGQPPARPPPPRRGPTDAGAEERAPRRTPGVQPVPRLDPELGRGVARQEDLARLRRRAARQHLHDAAGDRVVHRQA